MSLFLYDATTHTVHPVHEQLYLCDTSDMPPAVHTAMTAGTPVPAFVHKGVNLDLAMTSLRGNWLPHTPQVTRDK